MKRLMVAAGFAMLAACATGSGAGGAGLAGYPWVGAWGASPAPQGTGSRAFENQTIRQVVRVAAGGQRIRIRFTNEYNDKPLAIGAATVAIAGPDGRAAGTPIAITFGGVSKVSVPRAAALLSDPITLPVKALDQVSISLFLPEATGPCTCHPLGTANSFISGPGDFTKTGFSNDTTFNNRAFISAVEVETAAPVKAIIAFGDSITDGYKSTPDANRRWPDVLAERLNAARKDRSVVNEAISGNRVLGYQNVVFGDPALARFDRDVLTVPNARWMVVLEGINDIGMGRGVSPTADELIAGHKQLIERAHARGLKAYGATLIPFEGAAYYTEAGETIRQAVNAWIRSGKGYDGVIDFDAAMRDPANPKKMVATLQSGDWLHPNDAGYKVMGEAIDLKLFN